MPQKRGHNAGSKLLQATPNGSQGTTESNQATKGAAPDELQAAHALHQETTAQMEP